MLVVLLFSFLAACDANVFRGQGIHVAHGSVRGKEIKDALLSWALGGGGSNGEHRMTEENLLFLEDSLRPTFVSLPKNTHGNLGHAAVRYALHRFFVHTHGMYIKGLEPAGDTWDKTQPTGIIEDRVPAYVHGLFETLLGDKGFNQHELAVLAATLEHLVYEDQIQRLHAAYKANGLEDDMTVNETVISEVVESYMQIFLVGKNGTDLKGDEFVAQRKAIAAAYPNWPETREFLERVRGETLGTSPESSKKFAFSDAAHVVQEVGRQYGRFQNSECQDLKKSLVGIEDQGSGRVKMQDFYSGAGGGKWQFSESVAYLKQLGALDDSDPSQLRVFISNYLNSPSNCLVSSSFFSTCCINECEDLLGGLERRIAGPDAKPEQILELIPTLGASSTIITEKLRNRLEEVARHHGGLVPLHGRLFAQWLHHAYPRECPYPHRSGTTRPLTADEWIQETGLSSKASPEEILQHTAAVDEDGELARQDSELRIGSEDVEADDTTEDTADSDVVETHVSPQKQAASPVDCPPSPWEPEEELVVSRPSAVSAGASARHPFFEAVSSLVLVVALVAMGLNAKQIVQATLKASRGDAVMKKL